MYWCDDHPDTLTDKFSWILQMFFVEIDWICWFYHVGISLRSAIIVLQFSLVSFAGTSIFLCLQAPGGATITPEAMAQLQAKMGWDDSPEPAFRKMIIHSRKLTWIPRPSKGIKFQPPGLFLVVKGHKFHTLGGFRAPKIYHPKDVGEGCFGDVPIFRASMVWKR